MMTENEVTKLMESSKSENEWNNNCDIVKRECGGYPPFWYSAIVISGLMGKTASSWGKDDKIHVRVS